MKIKLYGHAGCGPCTMVKTLLNKAGAEFEYMDVTKGDSLSELENQSGDCKFPAICAEGVFYKKPQDIRKFIDSLVEG